MGKGAQRSVALAVVAIVVPLASSAAAAVAERLALKVIATYPHDPGAFTQGLLLHRGRFYESTGLYGSSTLRRVDPVSGEVQRSATVNPAHFAEGLARVPGGAGDRLIQLSWRAGVARIYDLESFAVTGTFAYAGEGWGLCYDPGRQRLVMSDGSSVLALRDPRSFAVTGSLKVTLNGSPRDQLNELACVGDVIYANVWQSDAIVRIDANSGGITGVIDASGLLSAGEAAGADVLNGIAYDPAHATLLVTGKRWPKLFEVEIVPATTHTPATAPTTPKRSGGHCNGSAPGGLGAALFAFVLLRGTWARRCR